MNFKTCLYFWIGLIQTSSGEVSILLHGVDIDTLQNDNTVKIIEGQHLLFDCIHDIENVTVTWSRNNTVITRNTRLELGRIRIEDEGYYTCTISSDENTILEYSTVFLKILYPPSYPILNAPKSFLFNEEVSLTYLFEAEPEPTYQWRRLAWDGLLLSRNRTYRMTVPSTGLRIYCNFQSLMTPTFGEPRSAFISEYVFINVHRKASITSIFPGRYVERNEGDYIVLRCHVDGNPAPNIWWSKTGDESFYWHGGKYSKYNIDTNSAGDYVCHVENTVIPANRTQQIIHKTEVFHVFVNRKALNDQKPTLKCTDCFEQCTTVTDADPRFQSSTSTSTPSVVSSPNTTTDSTSFKSTNCSTEQHLNNNIETGMEQHTASLALIVATTLGWLVSFIMIGFNLYICKYKNKMKDDGEMSDSSHSAENQISNQISDVRSSYVTSVRFADNTYTDLTTYDQINPSIRSRDGSLIHWNDSESVSTQSSVVTYIEPISTLSHQ
ncbi:neural cell adhesion molecule 1-like [Mercenaria mercenaria]|uniref:neural cell adhesion molecule 1-like n=1 Tax=Mercenaria mercenaria TaxID=6596 RepID=UPI00234E6D92|nr:neural cell adhesion molecule 1-like [Mercenaria mercenaria]